MSDLEANWIKDGTPATEPETVSTPAVEAAPDPVSPDATAQDAQGAAATATPADEPIPPAPASDVVEYIEARLGDQPYQLPKNVLLPLKRGADVEWRPVDEVQRDGMKELDYRLKTQKAAEDRRAFEAERATFLAEQARIKARETHLSEREAELQDAFKSPEKFEAYQEHLRQYEANPVYRKMVDASLDQRETAAELAVYREQEAQRAVMLGAEAAQSWIQEAATKFPTVNPDRVREAYARDLRAGTGVLDPQYVEQLFRAEADYVAQTVTPLRSELDALKAQIAALSSAKATDAHNATTQHALARAKAPPVATGVAPQPARTPLITAPFGIRDLPDANAKWAAQRD